MTNETHCLGCFGWLTYPGASTHTPAFPDEAWEIVESEEFEVGPNEIGLRGKARCKTCGRIEEFNCEYPGGYFFPIGRQVPWL